MSYLSKWSSKLDKKQKSKVSYASSFWADEWSNYDDDVFAESYYDDEKGVWTTKKLSTSESSTVEMLRLSAHRRAIANFVNILTNKNIPVKFYKKGIFLLSSTKKANLIRMVKTLFFPLKLSRKNLT